MSEDKPKPCPFCGEDDTVLEHCGELGWYAWCLACGADGPNGPDPAEALRLWNARALRGEGSGT